MDSKKDLPKKERDKLIKNQVFVQTLDEIQNGVIIADAQADDVPIIYVNKAFEKLTGYKSSFAIGKNCRFLQGKKTDQKTVKKIRKAINQKKEINVELINYKKNGQKFWNELKIKPLKDKQGKTLYFLGVQKDITEEKVYQDELRAKIEELRRFNEVAVDRELKMVELKKEIKALKGK